TILRFVERFAAVPQSFAFGLAAFLSFMRGEIQVAARARGARVPPDDQAEKLRELWGRTATDDDDELVTLARAFLSDVDLWATDLSTVPGLTDAVGGHLIRIERDGARAALSAHLAA